jgi:thiol-disulfide isomerase/thioredoxin
MKKQYLSLLLSLLTTISTIAATPKTGIWRGVLSLPDAELPFHFKVITTSKGYILSIINGKERIYVNEVRLVGDSLFARLPIFDSEFKLKVTDTVMTGVWQNNARKINKTIPFRAAWGTKKRFISKGIAAAANVTGRWEADFSKGTADSSKAVGEFTQIGNKLTGTFLTTTGDYRFLEGNVIGNELFLSCFDGAHAFLFKATMSKDGHLMGQYWSGNHWKEPWVAKRNQKYKLPDPNTLTFLKPGYEKFFFTFPSITGGNVSLADKQFVGKVVVVQIMGSWCPNCMDESKFLSTFYKKNHNNGLEIIGLAYEKAADPAQAKANVGRLKQRFGIEYPLLLAGSANKEEAAKTLPMLNQILSFPTTIIIDKKGIVRRIHTGYSGPATGLHYDEFVRDFSAFINQLLAE